MTTTPSDSPVVRGRLLTADRDLADVEVVVTGGRVEAINAGPASGARAPDRIIVPGLVDIHCHGGGGASFTAGDRDQVSAASADLLLLDLDWQLVSVMKRGVWI